MSEVVAKKAGIRDFPFVYWISIMFEFFERGAYYGVMSVLSIYLTDQLGFSKESVGTLKGVINPILYALPILTGALADKVGYRKTLMVAFSLLGTGYYLASTTTEYSGVFLFLVIMALGAGTFKPVISGTIAKVTDERNSTLGFGIFYWTINLGAFLFPLILVPILKDMDWSYVLVAAAICTGAMIIPTMFIYKEPQRDEEQNKNEPFSQVLGDVFEKIFMVFKDWKFILLIGIYSLFWILYFQMFDSVLWYMQVFVDTTVLDNFVSGILGFEWHFDVEHVTVVNALTIILLQIVVSNLVKYTKALPTMLFGIGMGVIGITMLAISANFWFFLAGIFIFSVGEMITHPKFISYLGMIAPSDKKATYMGFGFLYGVLGSSIGTFLGSRLYVQLVDNPMIDFVKNQLIAKGSELKVTSETTVSQAFEMAEKAGIVKADILATANTSDFWLVFSGIGVVCILGLLAYQKFIIGKIKK